MFSCSIHKKIAHDCFSSDKIDNKNVPCIAVVGCVTGNILNIFLALCRKNIEEALKLEVYVPLFFI